jgi:predicted regulator of Ras-like GTPase activity (Roadblock/LC7/MglB family)
MQNLLEEITTSPGVMGSCVYVTERGVLASNLPKVFNPDIQKRIASILHRIFKLNETVKLDVSSYEIQYDEALILVKRLCDASSLVVICDPDANVHLVNMSISVLASDLVSLIKECENTPPVEAEPVQKPQVAPPVAEPVPTPQEPATVDSVINNLMVNEMSVIRKALAKGIGPIATMTLEDEVEKWLDKGAPSKDRLAELAENLLGEIDDDSAQKEFMDDLKSIL